MPAPPLCVDIRRDRRAPGRARRAVDRLAGYLDPEVLHDVKLLVSELVTNSVKYGSDEAVHLTIECSSSGVRVEVADRGAGFIPAARERAATEPGGWGLHLVQVLSDRWGVHQRPARVWFEIRRGARTSAVAA